MTRRGHVVLEVDGDRLWTLGVEGVVESRLEEVDELEEAISRGWAREFFGRLRGALRSRGSSSSVSRAPE